jgi:hypothetical protein
MLFFCTVFLLFKPAIFAQTSTAVQAWTREEKSDPLRGTQFSQFRLGGRYLTPPKNAAPDAVPSMIVRCRSGNHNHGHVRGQFLEGYIFVGSVVDSHVSDDLSGRVTVQFRLDDGKLQVAGWGNSTDYSAIFFDSEDFNNLLYGHMLPHKENTNPQVRKVVIGVPEYLGGEIVMQFDMPDSTDVAETCGVIWHNH